MNKLDLALSFNEKISKTEDDLIVSKLKTPVLNLVISYDKEETKLLTQQKVGWLGFAIYRTSNSAQNTKQDKK